MAFDARAFRPVRMHQSHFEKSRFQFRDIEDSIASNKKTQSDIIFAQWENRTHDSIIQRNRKIQVDKLVRDEEALLQERRRRLAAQREQQVEQWKMEIETNVETLEQKKERIRAKAMQLREVREASRKKFVDEMYEKQFRNSCDAARTLDSKAFVEYIATQRKQQVEERKLREKIDKEEDLEYARKIRERIGYLEAADLEHEEAKKRMRAIIEQNLSAQMSINAARRMEMELKNAEDDAKELQELRQILRDEEQKERERRENMLQYGKEVKETNASRRDMRKIQDQIERSRDLLLLQYALDKEEKDIQKERRKREEEKRVILEYSAHLKEQMEREYDDASELDRAHMEAENRMWEKKEEEQLARAEASRQLMKEVHATRARQVRERQKQEQMEQIYLEEQAAFDHEANVKAEREEEELQVEQRRKVLEHSTDLKRQIEERKARRERQQQEEYLQVKRMEAFERAHQKKLKEQAGKVVLHYPLKQSKWYS